MGYSGMNDPLFYSGQRSLLGNTGTTRHHSVTFHLPIILHFDITTSSGGEMICSACPTQNCGEMCSRICTPRPKQRIGEMRSRSCSARPTQRGELKALEKQFADPLDRLGFRPPWEKEELDQCYSENGRRYYNKYKVPPYKEKLRQDTSSMLARICMAR